MKEKKQNRFNNKKRKRTTHNETLEGVILGTAKNFMFCRVMGESEDFFVPFSKTKGALNGDRVLIKVVSRTADRTEAQIVKIINRVNKNLVGELITLKGELFFKADNPKISKYIKVEKRNTYGAKLGEKVVCKLTYQPENVKERFIGEIIEVLGDGTKSEVLELAIMREFNIYETYPKEVVDMSNSLSKKGITEEERKTRLDLTKKEIFTIDGETAKDFDDAVSLEMLDNGNYYLGVHIADVGHYVKRDNIIDKEAYLRGTSVYFPTLTFPMLPESLSNGICSLVEGEDRLTLSVFIEIDSKGNFKNHKVAETIINSKGRLTYTQVYKTLCDDKEEQKSDKFKTTLKNMNTLAKIIKQKRQEAGEIDFDIAEPYFLFDEKGEISGVVKRERNDAHRLIESFMIAANEVIAKKYSDMKMPFVYRVHEIPTMEKAQALVEFLASFGIKVDKVPKNITPDFYKEILTQIEDNPLKETINKIVLRSLQKAKYSQICMGHFGLALEYYCHFTSPIRRYPDLVIHRIIKDSLKNRKKAEDLENFVFEASEQSSAKERNADEAERAADDLKKAEYMKKHIGEEFEGIITSVTNFGFFVELDNTIEGLVRVESLPKDSYLYFEKSLKLKGVKHTYSIGDRVKIVVSASNVYERKIDFVLKENI